MHKHTQQRRHMPIKCAVVYQNRIWISCYLYNALYCYDIASSNMEYLGKFENQDMRDNLHRQIIRCGDILFFVPIYADGIDVYNIKEQRFESTIKSSCNEKITNRIALQISDEMVWLLPQNIKEPLYVLYTKERRLEPFFAWKKEIDQIFYDDDTFFISASGICVNEKHIYMAIFDKGIILEIDRETVKVRKIFSDENYRFASINCLGNALYLTELGSSGIIQIEHNKVVCKIENREIDDVEIPYCGMVQVKKGFLVIPYHFNDLYILDTKEKKLQKTDINFGKKISSDPCFLNWQMYEGNVFLYPGRAQSVLTVNYNNLEVHETDLMIPDNITDEWILKNRFDAHYNSGNVTLKESDYSLTEFIMLVEKERRIVFNSAERIGEEIYTSTK